MSGHLAKCSPDLPRFKYNVAHSLETKLFHMSTNYIWPCCWTTVITTRSWLPDADHMNNVTNFLWPKWRLDGLSTQTPELTFYSGIISDDSTHTDVNICRVGVLFCRIHTVSVSDDDADTAAAHKPEVDSIKVASATHSVCLHLCFPQHLSNPHHCRFVWHFPSQQQQCCCVPYTSTKS